MNTITIQQQTPKDKTWFDEQNVQVPYARTTSVERMKEKYAAKLAKDALKLHNELAEYKELMRGICNEVFNTVLTEAEIKASKGNFTWTNFNGTIKVEVRINENIDFDSLLIEKAKQKLLDLVGESITPDRAFVKDLVLSAFQTSKGKLDTKKILGLKKHASRIKDERYRDAMQLIDESIRRPDSATYFRVWVKDENGQFQNIDLNFSSI